MQMGMRLTLFVFLLIVAAAFGYRVLNADLTSATDVTGLVIVLALSLLVVLSDRISEFSASLKGVNAKLTKIDQSVSELRAFLLGSVDADTIKTLIEIREGSLTAPEDDENRDPLKFRLRTLRRASMILRDEATCKSISWSVKQHGNISKFFKITRLGEDLLKLESENANES